jgi:hypothetical protein
MATLQNAYPTEGFHVVHPLQDAPEQKCVSKGLGPIAITASVRFSLITLRGYLIAVSLMLLWHVLEVSGLIRGLR